MHALSVCMYRKSIFVSLVISYFSLCFIACLFSFIENQASFLSFLFLTFFRYSFRCPHRELSCSNNQHIKTGLAVGAGCTGAGMLSQAKIYWPECSAQVALYSENGHCTFASQYLASQHLYRLEVTDT